MSSRLYVPVVAILSALLLGLPARAQTPAEMAGVYHMTVVSKFGPCTTDPTFEVEVKGVEGDTIALNLGGQPYSAPYDAAARKFHLETADPSAGFRATMDGQFSRTTDTVVLTADATWAVGCGGKIVGQHPASAVTDATLPAVPPTDPSGPPQTYTFGGASAPEAAIAAACPPANPLSWMCVLLCLIMFLLGLAVGWLLFRDRGGETKPTRPSPDQAATDKESDDHG